MVKRIQLDQNAAVAAAAAVYTGVKTIPVQGASEVHLFVNVVSGGTIQGTVVEQSFDGGVLWTALDTTVLEVGGNASAVAATWVRVVTVSPRSGTSAKLQFMPPTHLRFKTTGAAGASPANDAVVSYWADVYYGPVGPQQVS